METKLFTVYSPNCVPLDEQINDWLSYKDVNVVDIKFTSSSPNVSYNYDGRPIVYTPSSALVMYKESERLGVYNYVGDK